MKLDLLYHHCADLGLEVEWRDLGERRRGEYRDHLSTIILNRRLTHAQAVAALAHEVGHAIFRDHCSTPEAERRASEMGALLVIDADEYRRAEQIHGPHLGAIACELGVTRHLVEAWQRVYRRKRCS